MFEAMLTCVFGTCIEEEPPPTLNADRPLRGEPRKAAVGGPVPEMGAGLGWPMEM